MIIIKNNIIPLKGFKAMNLFSVIFVRKGANFTDVTRRHEYIHTLQMIETLFIGFYIWYGIEYLYRCAWRIRHKPCCNIGKIGWAKLAYKDISFEQEAYAFENDADYIKNRKHFAWFPYLRKRNLIEL